MALTCSLRHLGRAIAATLFLASASCAPSPARSVPPPTPFQVEEATIADLHAAITSGRTTCRAVVEAYVARAKAYNGVCTSLVTADGADVPPATGYTRAGTPLLRIAVLREHMVKTTPNHEAIADALDREMKAVLRDQLGAELVETRAEKVPDDPDVPDVTYTFADALSELLPRLMPEVFKRRDAKGQLLFAVPGHDVSSYAYLLALSRRQAPLAPAITITNFATYGIERCFTGLCGDVAMDIDRYLAARGDATIKTWADWIAHAKFREDASRAGAENWQALTTHDAPWKTEHLARSYVGRLALQRMMRENRIAAFVHPENTVPTPKIQGPSVGINSLDGITPFFRIPRVVVPAGMSDVVVEPSYALNADRTDYVSVIAAGTPRTKLPHPMPIALTLFAGQGDEPTLIRIGTAYEAATRHRTPPPAFGPLPVR